MKEVSTIQISKKIRTLANLQARKEGMKLYAWIERAIVAQITPENFERKQEDCPKGVTCTECALFGAEHKVTITNGDKVKVKYLCHHCNILEE